MKDLNSGRFSSKSLGERVYFDINFFATSFFGGVGAFLVSSMGGGEKMLNLVGEMSVIYDERG